MPLEDEKTTSKDVAFVEINDLIRVSRKSVFHFRRNRNSDEILSKFRCFDFPKFRFR
jgi:hypothetical protein